MDIQHMDIRHICIRHMYIRHMNIRHMYTRHMDIRHMCTRHMYIWHMDPAQPPRNHRAITCKHFANTNNHLIDQTRHDSQKPAGPDRKCQKFKGKNCVLHPLENHNKTYHQIDQQPLKALDMPSGPVRKHLIGKNV